MRKRKKKAFSEGGKEERKEGRKEGKKERKKKKGEVQEPASWRKTGLLL